MLLCEFFDDVLDEQQVSNILDESGDELKDLISSYISDPLSDAAEQIIHTAAGKLKQWAIVKHRSGHQNDDLIKKIINNPQSVARQLVSNVFIKKISCSSNTQTSYI